MLGAKRRGLVMLGVLLVNLSLLTACNTVKGTVLGAKKDVKTTERAIAKTMR